MIETHLKDVFETNSKVLRTQREAVSCLKRPHWTVKKAESKKPAITRSVGPW